MHKNLYEDDNLTNIENDVADTDFGFDVIDIDNISEVVFEDDNYQIVKPLSADALIMLADGTKWLGGGQWNRNNREDDEIDYDSYIFKTWEKMYIIFDKHNPKKKYFFRRGDGQLYAPSYANYSCATWVAKNGSEDMWRWFMDQKFPYITTNLDKKVGGKLISSKNTFIYPDDVNNISWHARGDSNITKIVIREGTKKINSRAFANLTQVKEVVIPDSVTKLGKYCFSNCTSLVKITIPSGVTAFDEGLFARCSSLESFTISDNIKSIGNYCFDSCFSLKKVHLPEDLTEIPQACFDSCTDLTDVNIPDTITKIGDYAFGNCSKLSNIKLPSSLKEIGRYAFSGTAIKDIFIPASVEKMEGPIFCQTYWRGTEGTTLERHIVCEVSSKPAGWDRNWAASREDYNNTIHSWEYTQYAVEWGGKSANESLEEDVELEEAPIPGILTEEQCEKFLGLITSLDEISQEKPEEFKRICNEWLMNIWMEGDYPSPRKVAQYTETLTDPSIYHIPVFWAKTDKNGGKNYNICRFNEEGLEKLISDPSSWDNKHGNIHAGETICVSYNFLKDFLGINPDTLLEDIEDDTGFDIATSRTLFEDDTWSVYQPISVGDLLAVRGNAKWFTDNDNKDFDIEDIEHIFNRKANPYYVFSNKKTGENYLYSPTEVSWVGHGNGFLFTPEGTPYRTENWSDRYASQVLEVFLNKQGTPGLINWCVKKWPQGLKKLKNTVAAKQLVADNNYTIMYNSELYKQCKGYSGWWNREKTPEGIAIELFKHVQFPRNTRTIGDNAFTNFKGLEEVIIPNTVKTIEEYAFCWCESISKISLPQGLEKIGQLAFAGCSKNLTEIIIPKSVVTIGREAFKYDNNLKIYCEAESKPEGWVEGWDIVANDPNERFEVVWGYGSVKEDLEVETSTVEYDIPKDKRESLLPYLKRQIGLTEREFRENKNKRWLIKLLPDNVGRDELGFEIDPEDVNSELWIGDIGCHLTEREAHKLLHKVGLE